MKLRYIATRCIIALTLCISNSLFAAIPACASADSDLDGNGYGWENNQSCRVTSDDAAFLSVLHPSSPDNIISITWPAVGESNPFSSPPIIYEVWNNEALLATVDTNRVLVKLSELGDSVGCIRIRAVRGALKSDPSSPTCFVVRS